MSEKIIQLNEEIIKGQIKELVANDDKRYPGLTNSTNQDQVNESLPFTFSALDSSSQSSRFPHLRR